VAAKVDGKLVGSNFLQLSDAVAGVGPITVCPTTQAKGIGRTLMQDVIKHAVTQHGPQVRLVQDAVNTTSLSLYTSLGFEVKEPLAMVTVPPEQAKDETVRLARMEDLDHLDELCRRVYLVSRRNEVAGLIAHGAEHGMPVYLRKREARVVAYAIPGFLGHGVGETNEDLMATVRQAMGRRGGRLSRSMEAILCPSRNGELYRAILTAGGKTVRCLHLMAMGPYETPIGAWYPSIAY
jgi:GNAT superfamily N-acetyltransferase